jgi:hypothetical protein
MRKRLGYIDTPPTHIFKKGAPHGRWRSILFECEISYGRCNRLNRNAALLKYRGVVPVSHSPV